MFNPFAPTNLLTRTDSYKIPQHDCYHPGTSDLQSYVESRGCAQGFNFKDTMFFGSQFIVKRHFLQRLTHDMVDKLIRTAQKHFGRDDVVAEALLRRVVNELDGKLPLRVRAVREGSIVPLQNVLMTFKATIPEFYPLEDYFEALWLRVWYPTTVATWGAEAFRIFWRFLTKTTDLTDEQKLSVIVFMLHDFGDRGVTCDEQAQIGGMAHLSLFKGTDTMPALDAAEAYYGSDMAGFSVVATQHSIMTQEGPEGEANVVGRILDRYLKPGTIVSIVGDSYDIYHFTRNIIGGLYRDQIMQSGGKVVVRPDSGHPPTIVVAVMEILWECFGGTVNAKGFRELNPCVGCLQGDGIDLKMMEQILDAVADAGFAGASLTFEVVNMDILFGSGGARLQKMDRDTLKFAFKASTTVIDGERRDVYKQPITDPGKNSKRGLLDLVLTDHGYQTVTVQEGEVPENSQLVTLYENGELMFEETLDAIRERAYAQLIAQLKAEEEAERQLA